MKEEFDQASEVSSDFADTDQASVKADERGLDITNWTKIPWAGPMSPQFIFDGDSIVWFRILCPHRPRVGKTARRSSVTVR